MIEAQKRKTIYLLHQEGHGLKKIAHLMNVSRNTVREIIIQQGEMPQTVRRDKIEIDPELLRQLYADCDGFAQRVHEKLVEEHRVHQSTHEILAPLGMAGLKQVLGYFHQWRHPLESLSDL